MSDANFITLPADSNQALGLARYALAFLWGEPGQRGEPDPAVLARTNLFHTDAVLCGVSALALGTNAPNVLRDEALTYAVSDRTPTLDGAVKRGATVFGSRDELVIEKAIVANCAAVREWDSNGTNFGYNPDRGHTAGEFGHNDFYSVAIAGAQLAGLDGEAALRAMVLHDEIRGRLAEVFSLKSYKIDHVVHGAIASAATLGAMLKATPEQIESAVGMVVAHYIPWRAIRAGKQLSDSKGASAAISTEAAILALKRSMAGFLGPRDIFRNPEAIFRAFEGPGQLFQRVDKQGHHVGKVNTEKDDASPFDLVLARAGRDFAVMGMHFKIGLYEHQSAGAIQAMIDLVEKAPHLIDDASGERIKKIKITAYEPAFGIIGDPAKRNPTTRQSADHSMVYIIATVLRRALEGRSRGEGAEWTDLMLGPYDYSAAAIGNSITRKLMERIEFQHGGPDYDKRYPDGIPTSVVIEDDQGTDYDSGLVMYPAGHARNLTADLEALLDAKWKMLGQYAADDPASLIARYAKLEDKSTADIAAIHDFDLVRRDGFE